MRSWLKSKGLTIQMKATHEQFFPVVLFIMVKVLDAIFAPVSMNIQNTESLIFIHRLKKLKPPCTP